MAVMTLQITGEIPMKRLLNAAILGKNLDREIRRATKTASLFLIKMIIVEIKQKKYIKNSKFTLAFKSTEIALLDEQHMIRAITHKIIDSFTSEVGLLAEGEGKEPTGGKFGRSSARSMKQVIELMHTGYVVKVTRKSLAAMKAALARKGTKEAQELLAVFNSPTATTKRKGAWRVPPRPFLTRIFEDPETIVKLKKIWEDAVIRAFAAQARR